MKLVLFLIPVSTALTYLATRLDREHGRVPFYVLVPLTVVSMTIVYRLCDIGWQKPDAGARERFWARLLVILSTAATIIDLVLKAV